MWTLRNEFQYNIFSIFGDNNKLNQFMLILFEANPCRVCGGQSNIGTGISPSMLFSLFSGISPMFSVYSFFCYHCCIFLAVNSSVKHHTL